MIVFGLTGSIGMGKSTAALMLKKMGCQIHNSDKAVHHALSPNGQAFEEVALTFPDVWDKKTHTIKRAALANIIFNDIDAKERLEQILHPIVQQAQGRFIQKCRRLQQDFVVLDIPLLFETNAQNRVDYTIVVSAPYAIQRARVLKRPNMSEEKFYAILDAQMPDKEKCALADFIVPTGLGMHYTFGCLKNILEDVR